MSNETMESILENCMSRALKIYKGFETVGTPSTAEDGMNARTLYIQLKMLLRLEEAMKIRIEDSKKQFEEVERELGL